MLKQRAAAAVLLTIIILSFSMTLIPEGENPIYKKPSRIPAAVAAG